MKTNTTTVVTQSTNPVLVRYSDTQVYTGLVIIIIILSIATTYLWKKLP